MAKKKKKVSDSARKASESSDDNKIVEAHKQVDIVLSCRAPTRQLSLNNFFIKKKTPGQARCDSEGSLEF